MKAYMAAARPASSMRLMAWKPTLMVVRIIPLLMPKMARLTAQTGVLVSSSKSANKPHPTVVTAQPPQMAHRKRPIRDVTMEMTMLPGRSKQVTGNISRPACVGETKRTAVK